MKIAFDVKLLRPGCAIVQRALGADIPSDVLEFHFPAETWLKSPTDDMNVYPVTDEQLAKLSVMASNQMEKNA